MGKRRRARELAMQVLFASDFGLDDRHDAFELITENFRSDEDESVIAFSKQLVFGTYPKIKYLV